MKIGLSYDLKEDYLNEGYGQEEVAEFDKLETIEEIEKALHENGFETERIGNLKSLVQKLATHQRWDMVFNIAEGMYGMGREAQVPAILDAYQIPYTFSDPLVLALTLHKGLTKEIIRNAGIATADFFVVREAEDIEKVNLEFPLFAKPVAEGTGKGIDQFSEIKTKNELKQICIRLLEKFKQPVLVEMFLPGREFTVGILGTGKDAKAVGVMEVLYEHTDYNTYSYFNKANYEGRVNYALIEGELGDACKDLSLKVWRVLDCRDAGRIDIRLDAEGVPNFIEINPLAGLNAIHSDLPIVCRLAGMNFTQLIKEIMDSAIKRL